MCRVKHGNGIIDRVPSGIISSPSARNGAMNPMDKVKIFYFPVPYRGVWIEYNNDAGHKYGSNFVSSAKATHPDLQFKVISFEPGFIQPDC